MNILREYQYLLGSVDFYLLLAMGLIVTYQLVFYIRLLRTTRPAAPADTTFAPPVSIIVCARNEQRNLQDYLHAILTQDYPCFELIVVDDGSEDDTSIILEQMTHRWPNLYRTFVPQGARVLSSKKLALTIGIKAANHDYILLTDADCRPQSPHWIREMIAPFADDSVELVLGCSPYFEGKSLLSSLISYDTLFIALQYMAFARSGHPYMGVGRNMAYRKATFFAHNGFQGLLSERSGDDDLFVNKVATAHNTRCVCSQDSLTWSAPEYTWKNWFQQKRRHLSVASHYKFANKFRLFFEPFTRAMLYVLLVLAFVLGSGYTPAIALALYLLRCFMQRLSINLSARRLGIRCFGAEMILHDLFLPLCNIYLMISKRLRKKPIYW